MKYNIKDKKEKIRIFGEKFFINNYSKCLIIYKNEIYPLKEYFPIKQNKNNKLEIKLLVFRKLTNFCSMFSKCEFLEEFEFEQVVENNIINNHENKNIDDENSGASIDRVKNILIYMIVMKIIL